jgi:membrane protease YdiL (CAAX protease family)
VREPILTKREIALLGAPPALLATTLLSYNVLVAAFGLKLGYFLGFHFYWIFWCLIFPLWVLGLQGLRRLFRDARPRFGRPAWLRLAFLLLPLIVGYGYEFPLVLPHATPGIVLASAAIALVNATAEEVLWRGTYAAVFPGRAILGYLYPAVGFALWHLAPQSVFASTAPGGAALFVLVSLLFGLTWSWVAWRTGSIRWTTLSHVLLHFSGLGALFYFGG